MTRFKSGFVQYLRFGSIISLFFSGLLHAETRSDDSFIMHVKEIETRLGARIGLSIWDSNTGRKWEYNADQRFPMASTFKPLVCAHILTKVDAGEDELSRIIKIKRNDLVTYSPITKRYVDKPGMEVGALCQAAIQMSDNTAGNKLLESVGGTENFTRFLRSIGDSATRLDRYEPVLNEAIPGDPRDTTTPNAMVQNLSLLIVGDVLSIKSKKILIKWLMGNKTGDALLRKVLPDDWVMGDKTGSAENGTRNLISVMWPPNKKSIIGVFYITESKKTTSELNAIIAELGTRFFALLSY